MNFQSCTEDFIRELYIAYIPISFIITHTPRGDELETCTSLSTKIIKDTKNKRRINIDISTSVRLGTIAGIITNILTIPVDTVSMNLQISKSIKRMGIFELTHKIYKHYGILKFWNGLLPVVCPYDQSSH